MEHRILMHQIGARLDLVRESGISQFDLCGKLLDPMMVQGEDVVPKPDMFHPIYFLEFTYLSRNQLR